MKKIILALAFLFFPLFIVSAQEIGLDPTRIWDFGQIQEGVIAEHAFTLNNDSTEKMNIENIDTSCGCTVSSVGKKILEPGEETELRVKFDSKGYSGKIKQFIFVNVNRLNDPVIQFVIEADVKKGG
ncbi:MAG: DUF1573 domain-containing protein [Candidatus Omnitrophica bacterium]|nr:DUF1573 domain-containing protein [Candidatus Omnitrophota bacterium]